MNLKELFENTFGREKVFFNEPMSKHTTFHIGGNADCFLKLTSCEEVIEAVKLCREKGLKLFILGNGSNILVGDGGIRGVVIQLEKGFDLAEFDTVNMRVKAESGILLTKLSNLALKYELSGLECISGIPGTLGGAVYMNAGAYGDEIANHIISVTFIDEKLNVVTIDKEACEFGYRKSIFTDSNKIILSAVLQLEKAPAEKIKERMAEYTHKRVTKQPIDKFSAGSTFKRPEGNFAGTLIERSGLKGKTIGGAQVSEKHAGFIINTGSATAKEVLDLVKYVQKTVYKNSGVMLEPEIKKIGEFGEEN